MTSRLRTRSSRRLTRPSGAFPDGSLESPLACPNAVFARPVTRTRTIPEFTDRGRSMRTTGLEVVRVTTGAIRLVCRGGPPRDRNAPPSNRYHDSRHIDWSSRCVQAADSLPFARRGNFRNPRRPSHGPSGRAPRSESCGSRCNPIEWVCARSSDVSRHERQGLHGTIDIGRAFLRIDH